MPNPLNATDPSRRHPALSGPNLPETKKSQSGVPASRGAVVGLNAANTLRGAAMTAGYVGGSAAAIAGPALTLVTSLASLHLAHAEGKELNESLRRDVAHQVTLRLAADVLPARYVHEASQDRLVGYHADADARELLWASCDHVMTAVAREAGGMSNAQKAFGDSAGDGMNFALTRGLSTQADIDLYRRTNPAFRERYDTDVAFHHGVRAGVWLGQTQPEPQRRLQ
ncbi:MAG: hypothetical protein ACOC1F_12110 [Myxococcota bacterium]